jgi:hypothetical protein
VPRLSQQDIFARQSALSTLRRNRGRARSRHEGGTVIVFGTVSAYPEKLATQCAPGIARSMSGEPYIHYVVKSNGREIFSAYQQLMLVARDMGSECDALVLLHDDLELRDPRLAAKIAAVLAPDVGIAGLIGSVGAQSLAWWEGTRYGRVTDDAYGLHDFGGFGCDVDSLDGMMLVLSPWACGRLRLHDIGYEGFHGYADDLCYQARKHGMRSVVADITAHHHSKGGYAGGIETWTAANQNFRKRWHA